MKTFGIVGWSGSGKTTLLESLLPILVKQGLRVSVIKQSHHDFEIDRPGKDSWRHRQAGASEVLLTSPHRWALIGELRGRPEPTLEEHLDRLSPCDLVLVEGFKRAAIPKLEVWRQALGKPCLCPEDPRILAVAGDPPPADVRHFPLDDVPAIARFNLASLKIGCEA